MRELNIEQIITATLAPVHFPGKGFYITALATNNSGGGPCILCVNGNFLKVKQLTWDKVGKIYKRRKFNTRTAATNMVLKLRTSEKDYSNEETTSSYSQRTRYRRIRKNNQKSF
jgi:hypothetical protein